MNDTAPSPKEVAPSAGARARPGASVYRPSGAIATYSPGAATLLHSPPRSRAARQFPGSRPGYASQAAGRAGAPSPRSTSRQMGAALIQPQTLQRLLDHVVGLARQLHVTRARKLRL